MNSEHSQDDRHIILFKGKRCFETECGALTACKLSGATPQFFYKGELQQTNIGPFPRGYLRIIVMSKIRGKSVVNIYNDLSQGDRRFI
jgi:hypothetical protein